MQQNYSTWLPHISISRKKSILVSHSKMKRNCLHHWHYVSGSLSVLCLLTLLEQHLRLIFYFSNHFQWLQLDRRVLEHEFLKSNVLLVLHFAIRYAVKIVNRFHVQVINLNVDFYLVYNIRLLLCHLSIDRFSIC